MNVEHIIMVIKLDIVINKELKDINIVEAEASRIKIIQSFYERRGYAQISIDLCLMLMVELFLINL